MGSISKLLRFAFLLALAVPLITDAQTVRTRGSIRNDTTTWMPGTATLPVNARGTSIAAAQTAAGGTVNDVEAPAPATSFRVNGAAAAGAEVTIMNGIIADARAIPAFAVNPQQHRNGINALKDEISSCTRLDADKGPAGNPRTCQVTANAGTFTPTPKAVGTPISVDAGNVVGMADKNTIETAQASAQQTLRMRGMQTVNLPNETADSSVLKGGSSAVAIAVNRDPMAVEWPSAGDRSVTYDLTGLALDVQSLDTGSTAYAYFATTTRFVDNTLDLGTPESDALLLFDLVYGISADFGLASVFDVFSFGVPCALIVPATCNVSAVIGSVSHTGIAAVTADLQANFQRGASGVWGFALPISFTVTLPGSATRSVLFMEDQAVVVAQAVAEPESLWLTVAALAAFGSLGFMRRRTHRLEGKRQRPRNVRRAPTWWSLLAATILVPQVVAASRLGSWDDRAGAYQAAIAEPDTAHSHFTLNGGDQLDDFLLSDALFTGTLTQQLYSKDTVIKNYSALLFALDSCAAGGFIGDLGAKDNKESGLGNAANVRPGIGVMTAAAYNRCSTYGGKGDTALSLFSLGFNTAVGPPHPESDAWTGAYKTASKAIQQGQELTGNNLATQSPQYWSTGDAIDSRTLKPGANDDIKDVAFLVIAPSDKNDEGSEQSFWNDLVKLHNILVTDYGWSDAKDSKHELVVLFADGSKPTFVKDNINWIDGAATTTALVNELARVHNQFSDQSLGFFYFSTHGASTEPFATPEPATLSLLVVAVLLATSRRPERVIRS